MHRHAQRLGWYDLVEVYDSIGAISCILHGSMGVFLDFAHGRPFSLGSRLYLTYVWQFSLL